ncbi:MAG: hypothetical protein NTZ42_02875 [Candidatus Gribaldobacteria bacterium]|nr:hypothetical protein [Candidatus Gribaldobacteria bacterium]
MKNLAGFSRGQSCFLVEHFWGIGWALVIFIIICACCLGRADSDDIYYLADRDQSLDRVVGNGVQIGFSQYFSRGVSVSTGPESLGSVTVVATVDDPNVITLEVSFETKGKGKAFIVKNDITEKSGEVIGDTHDLFCTKPKIFYLYPASEYLNGEGQLEISVGAQEGDTLDANYVRVRALDYRPLSTRQEARIVYDYPPTYVSSAPSIWFAIYRGPYYDYSAGYYNNYYGWWDRPEYYAWYRPYYQRVIVPVYNQYNYFFYNERHCQWRGGYSHDRYRDNDDRGRGGRGVSRLTDRVLKSAGGSGLDIRRGTDVVRAKQNLNRRTEQQRSRVQREPEQRLTGLTLDKNGATPDTRSNNLRVNPGGEKVRRDEPRQQPRQPVQQQQVQREQPIRAVQSERVVQQQNRSEQKRIPESRVEQQRTQPQSKVESRSSAPPKKDEEEKNNQQKHRK